MDLTVGPPRSCRVEIDGIGYLARAIDKVRAQLPDGNLGSYLVLGPNPTMSELFYRMLHIAHQDFVDAVTASANDEDVARWVRARVDDERIARWNETLYGLRLTDVPLPRRERVRAAHPGATHLPEDAFLVDMFDADDAVAFAEKL